MIRATLLAVLAGAAVLLLPPQPAISQPAGAISDPVAMAIAVELESLMDPAVNGIQGAHIAFQELIQDFYARRAYRPAWGDAKNASELRRAIADSAADGLNPADYFQPLLEDLARQARDPAATPMLLAQHDILLTEALLRLGYHLSFGKVDPETFDAQWNYGRTLDDRDVAGRIERALASQDIYQRIEALKPTHRLYGELKRELARYRAAESSAAPAPIPAGASLEPGASDPRVPLLRARLIASGDLAADAAQASDVYDAALEAAMRRFQQRMGLESDGVIGAGTVTELNVPVAERIRLLRVNLDRGRVIMHDLPEQFVIVNIAGFTAYLVRGQNIAWNGRVQVGKTYRKTPLFRSEINYLVFNPTWTVPPGIIANDILPAAKKDPTSITRRGLKVLDKGGREVDPASVDWSRFRGGHIPYTLRQDPGPKERAGTRQADVPESLPRVPARHALAGALRQSRPRLQFRMRARRARARAGRARAQRPGPVERAVDRHGDPGRQAPERDAQAAHARAARLLDHVGGPRGARELPARPVRPGREVGRGARCAIPDSVSAALLRRARYARVQFMIQLCAQVRPPS